MFSIMGFIENHQQKAAAQKQRDVEGAVLRRDVFGPSHSGKQRRRDVKVLRDVRPAAMTDSQGQPFAPVTAAEIGDGFRSKQKKKALPKYNATRPLRDR